MLEQLKEFIHCNNCGNDIELKPITHTEASILIERYNKLFASFQKCIEYIRKYAPDQMDAEQFIKDLKGI